MINNEYKNNYCFLNDLLSNKKSISVFDSNGSVSDIEQMNGEELTISNILDIIDEFNYFVIKPLNNLNELIELIQNTGNKYEFSLEYLVNPESWQGPLDMQCVISLNNDNTKIEASFYNKDKTIWLPQNDLETALKKMGLIGGDGLMIVTKGTGDKIIKYETAFNSNIPYLSMHYHPGNNPFPSDDDKRISSEMLNEFTQKIKTPVNELFTIKNNKEEDDVIIIQPFITEDIKKGIKAHPVSYVSSIDAYKMIETGFANKFINEEGTEILIPKYFNKNFNSITIDSAQNPFIIRNIAIDWINKGKINFNSKIINNKEMIIFYLSNLLPEHNPYAYNKP